ANLLLARGAARAGEMAIRAALGAGRARMVRQLLTESVVLALVSAGAGLALAVRVARSDVQGVLKEGGRGAGMGGVRDRLRTGLIVGELAIALVLLVGAGLLIRTSLALQRVQLGFDPHGVASARLT